MFWFQECKRKNKLEQSRCTSKANIETGGMGGSMIHMFPGQVYFTFTFHLWLLLSFLLHEWRGHTSYDWTFRETYQETSQSQMALESGLRSIF